LEQNPLHDDNVRRQPGQQLAQRSVELGQPPLERVGGRRSEDAGNDGDGPPALLAHGAVAAAGKAGVDAEHEH
jgi:hypothetical protein